MKNESGVSLAMASQPFRTMFGCIYEHVCFKLYACVDIKPHIYEMKYFECVPPCAGAKSF